MIRELFVLLTGLHPIHADPSNYSAAVVGLEPGDVVLLAPGRYRDCLELDGLHGTPEDPIVIGGPEDRSAVFLSDRCDGWTNRSRMIVKIEDSSWLILRNLELDGGGRPVDGIEAGYGDTPVHHLTIENVHIHDNARTNQETGISSFATAWDWIIRNNIIERSGAGLYLGNSDGRDPFIRGTIEGNLIIDPLGYGMQIKHQVERPSHADMPPDGSSTIIRNNVFMKASGSSIGTEARPNLLVGHFPLEGHGSNDRYQISGNLFFENQSNDEPLFQGEGNIEFFDNVLINSHGAPCLAIQPHNDVPRDVRIHHNTFLCAGPALEIRGGSLMHAQTAIANAIFSDDGTPLVGVDGDNVVGNLIDALFILQDPSFDVALYDLHPLPGAMAPHYGAFAEP